MSEHCGHGKVVQAFTVGLRLDMMLNSKFDLFEEELVILNIQLKTIDVESISD